MAARKTPKNAAARTASDWMRVRCAVDDGTERHVAINVRMPLLMSDNPRTILALLEKLRCACGGKTVILTGHREVFEMRGEDQVTP